MMNSTQSNIAFCPYHGLRLTDRQGIMHCPDPACDFADYLTPAPCVAILILDGGKILLVQRRDPPRPGAWDIPGGFIDPGETAEEATLREASEELGVVVEKPRFVASLPDVYGRRGRPTLNLCFVTSITSGTPVGQSDAMNPQWFALANCPADMAFAHQRTILGKLPELIGALR